MEQSVIIMHIHLNDGSSIVTQQQNDSLAKDSTIKPWLAVAVLSGERVARPRCNAAHVVLVHAIERTGKCRGGQNGRCQK